MDESTSEVIILRSEAQPRGLDDVLARIERRREDVARRNGELDDSAEFIREGREQELR